MGRQAAGHDEERGGREVAGNLDIAAAQLLAAGEAHAPGGGRKLHAKPAQHALGVIAGRGRFRDVRDPMGV